MSDYSSQVKAILREHGCSSSATARATMTSGAAQSQIATTFLSIPRSNHATCKRHHETGRVAQGVTSQEIPGRELNRSGLRHHCKRAQSSRTSAGPMCGDWANAGGKAMKVLAASITLLVSTTAAAAQECQMCSTADACIAAYAKATSEAQRATKVAIRDWHQNLDKKASAEFSSRGAAALQNVMLSQVRTELDRLIECLAKIK
jgi:hypothetical protein